MTAAGRAWPGAMTAPPETLIALTPPETARRATPRGNPGLRTSHARHGRRRAGGRKTWAGVAEVSVVAAIARPVRVGWHSGFPRPGYPASGVRTLTFVDANLFKVSHAHRVPVAQPRRRV